MSAILLWLAGTAAVPRWLICLGAMALIAFLGLAVTAFWLWVESVIFNRKDLK